MTGEEREEAIKLLTQYIDYDAETPDYYEMEKACKVAIKALEKQPCKGEWIRHTRVENVYDIKGIKTWGIKHQCNKCSFTTIAIEDFGYYDFCPHCGADMRGEKE